MQPVNITQNILKSSKAWTSFKFRMCTVQSGFHDLRFWKVATAEQFENKKYLQIVCSELPVLMFAQKNVFRIIHGMF